MNMGFVTMTTVLFPNWKQFVVMATN